MELLFTGLQQIYILGKGGEGGVRYVRDVHPVEYYVY
jgi:hypothetical protein